MKRNAKYVLLLSAMIVTVCLVVCLAACDGGKLTALDAPSNLRYDGSSVTWDAVENAGKYSIKINGGTELDCATNRFVYAAGGTEFTVVVKAISSVSDEIVSQEATMTFKPLPTVSGIRSNELGELSWDVVAGATSYELRIDGDTASVITLASPLFTEVPVGRHSIEARGIIFGDNSYYSVWSTPFTMTKLGAVDADTITYDGTSISFGVVSGADSYDIFINGQVVAEGYKKTKYEYNAENLNFEVSIKANGNNSSTFGGAESDVKKFVFLQQVTGLKIADGMIMWDEVAGADGYILKIGNSDYTINDGTSYSGSAIKSGTNLDISIKPFANDSTYFSAFTPTISAFILPSPVPQWETGLSLDGGENSLTWNLVDGATGYVVSVTDPSGNTNEEAFGNTQQNYSNLYEEPGEYIVRIRATANEAQDNKYSSMWSSEVKVVRPEAPEQADNFVVSNPTNLQEGFTVTCKTGNSKYTYKLYQDGSDIQTSSTPQFKVNNLADENVVTGREYTYEIQVRGSVSTINGGIYAILNSKDKLEFKITVLATPQNITLEGYTISYSSVSGAEYGYAITGIGGGSNFVSEDDTSRSLDTDLQAGNYNLQVCAKGDGKQVLASNYSAEKKVHRIGAPYDLKIDTSSASGGVLKYTVEDYATSVNLYVNNEIVATNAESIDNMNQYITTDGVSVSLVANANKYGEDGTYYMTSKISESKMFVKLTAPNKLTFDNDNLSWNLEGISDAQSGQIAFQVYNGVNDVLFTQPGTARSVSITNLAGGQQYNFYVRAMGDGEYYINSDYSELASVYKLSTPNVTKGSDGTYQWYGVSSAVNYSVTVNGTVYDTQVHQSGEKYSFSPTVAFVNTGKYTVSVKAIGNGGIGDIATVSSAPCVIEQEVAQLNIPEFSVGYDKDNFSTDGNIVVEITKPVDYATGYTYMIGNITEEKTGADSTEYKYNPHSVGSYTVTVSAIGGSFTEEGVFMVASRSSSEYTINLLGAPDESSFVLDGDGRLTFTGIANAASYKMSVTITTKDGTTITKDVTVTVNAYNLGEAVNNGDFGAGIGYGDVSEISITLQAIGSTAKHSISSMTVTRAWNNVH